MIEKVHIKVGNGKVIHLATKNHSGAYTDCGTGVCDRVGSRGVRRIKITIVSKEVTCKKCLKYLTIRGGVQGNISSNN